MSEPKTVQIQLPNLTDVEANCLLEALHEVVLIVDTYYTEQICRNQRFANPVRNPNHQDPCQRRTKESTLDDPLPF